MDLDRLPIRFPDRLKAIDDVDFGEENYWIHPLISEAVRMGLNEREARTWERAEAIHQRQHDCTFVDEDHRRAYYFVAKAELEREDEME